MKNKISCPDICPNCKEAILKPHLKKGLNIIFVGFNSTQEAIELGGFFKRRNGTHLFWEELCEAGITDKVISQDEAYDYGIGCTDIFKCAAGTIVKKFQKKIKGISRETGLSTREIYKRGTISIKKEISTYSPKIACLLGIYVWKWFNGIYSLRKTPIEPKFGWQKNRIGNTKIFLCAFPAYAIFPPYNRKEARINLLKKLSKVK